MKKYILGLMFAVMAPVMFAYAATPMLTVTGNDNNDSVTVRVTGGEINSPVELFYNRLVGDVAERRTLGTTDINGNFTGVVSTAGLGIIQISPVYVQVGGYQSLPVNWPLGTGGTTATSSNIITFTPAAPNFPLGQSGTVTISGGAGGTYYIASNSNPNFTSASVSGNTLTLSGSQLGQSTITVCSTAGPCAVITPNFSSTGMTTGTTTAATGSPMLSQSSLNINQGGQGSIMLSGGTAPYTVSVLGGNSVSTTLVGSTLYVNGNTTGTTMLTICSANTATAGTACAPLTVNVQGQGQATTTGALSLTFPLVSGETMRLSLSGGNGTYFVQSSGTTPVTASVNGNMLTLVGTTVGSASLNVCSGTSAAATTCLPIGVIVTSTSNNNNNGTGGGFLFETNLSMGMSGQDVLELQNRLRDEGYFNVTPTGYYGPLTASAVRAYQAANGLSSVGIVGPQTRALLNQ
jgi:hypothetical protein